MQQKRSLEDKLAETEKNLEAARNEHEATLAELETANFPIFGIDIDGEKGRIYWIVEQLSTNACLELSSNACALLEAVD